MKISKVLFLCVVSILLSCQNQSSKDSMAGEIVNPDGSVTKRTFKANGKLFAEITKKDGKKNGLTKNFYDNGKVSVQTNYKDDKKDGESIWYYTDGKVCQHTIYKNDVKDGIDRHYYKNGKLAAEIPFKNGEVEPGLKEYSREGKPINNIPTIVVRVINNVSTQNKYILQLTLSNKSENVSFSRVYIEKEKKSIIEIPTFKGVGNAIFPVKPGTGINEDVILEASFETAYGNPFVARTVYKLVVRN
ncbi:MAG: toxin-antitoxin system YwqK family antitoxin [Bacteroidales bacterium]